MRIALLIGLISIGLVKSQKALSKSTGPPAFFLQDPNDGLCLAGDKYRRCAIDTLWYVTGKPGTYQIHHRLVDETDEGSCLDRASCHLDESEVGLSNCNHCGAKKWNILGDAETGYVLTEDGNKVCALYCVYLLVIYIYIYIYIYMYIYTYIYTYIYSFL
jgi:hypothetical protein